MRRNTIFSIAGGALMLCAVSVTAASAATTWNVPGSGSNVCTIGDANCDTISQAVAASSDGDTILIGAGTFSGAANSNLVLTKSLTIVGAGRTNTIVQPDTVGFSVRASNISISDLAIQGGTAGVIFTNAASDNTQLRRITFDANTTRGIDFTVAGGAQAVTNVTIDDCSFAVVPTQMGIRLASNSQIAGLTISNSTFTGNKYGIYQANDGNTSTFVDVLIDTCTFTNNSDYAIYTEEMRDVTIEDSVFTNNGVGILLLKFWSGALPASNITIQRNQFTQTGGAALDLELLSSGLENPINIVDNTISLDVGALPFNGSAIFVSLSQNFAHAPVNITDNDITLAGTFTSTTAAYGVRVRRNGPIVLSGNTIDGGGVGGTGNTPATSGLFIETATSAVNVMPATATITASCNQITGFRNGVSVFDTFNGVYGGLVSGATVALSGNDITGNSDAGVVNGASSETVGAQGNWWGCSAGPGNPGCDGVSGAVDASSPALAPEPCESGCTPAPQTCRTAAKSILLVKDKADDSKDKLIWKWIKGQATSQAEFGVPTATTAYTLCVYAGTTSALVGEALIPPGPTNWSLLGTKGYKFGDASGTPDGVTKAILKGNTQNKAKALVKGKGTNLPDLTLPIAEPVTVQLVNGDSGLCFGADYSGAQFLKNQAGLLKAKAQ